MTKEQKAVNIRIDKFNEIEFSRKEISDDLQKDLENNPIQIGFNVEFNISKEKNIISVRTEVFYHYKKDGENIRLLFLNSSLDFIIIELSDFIKEKEDGSFNIVDDILITTVSLTIGTVRGVLIEKNSGKFIGKFILPPFDPTQILNNRKKKK